MKQVVSIRLNDELKAKVQTLADKEQRTFTNMVEVILTKYTTPLQ